MGGEISKAADSVGSVLGNAFMAPFKSIFGQSCEGVCSGPWDVICFIEHLCVSNILRLLMILVLCYIFLLFLYILFKIGICQCIGKSLCKMCWASCETYCFALEDITCFLWHKLLNTKRVNRRRRRRRHRRFRDIEQGYGSGDESDITRDNYHHHHHRFAGINRTNSSAKRRRRDQRSAATRQVSVNVRGGPRRLRRSARSLQLRKVRNVGIEAKISKRRRLK